MEERKDTISRHDAIDALKEQADVMSTWVAERYKQQSRGIRTAINIIEDLPTVEPRAKGKWDFIGDNMFMCTSCGATYTVQQLECLKQRVTDSYLPPCCPNCGRYNGENVEQPDKKEE